MTADWRATLERVAEKLAQIERTPSPWWSRRWAQEAQHLLRGRVAEPQPEPVDPEGLDICKHGMVGRCRDCLKAEIKLLREICRTNGWPGLAEPQVNPSEANFVIETLRNPPGDLILAYVRSAFSPHINGPNTVQRSQALHDLAAVADWFVVRAGLLAEGEESREP